MTSAGIPDLWQQILEHRSLMKESGDFAACRRFQQVK